MITEQDRTHLKRCIELAEQGLNAGDEPFGSVLVSAEGEVLFEDHNRVSGGDGTRHPEFEIARWAADHLTPEQRQQATVYTSGEHCPMCAAAHAWVGLGRIVFASSSEQLANWLQAMNLPAPPVSTLPINTIAPGVQAEGPVADLAEQVYELHRRRHQQVN